MKVRINEYRQKLLDKKYRPLVYINDYDEKNKRKDKKKNRRVK
jgi:hypothetical protein